MDILTLLNLWPPFASSVVALPGTVTSTITTASLTLSVVSLGSVSGSVLP